MYAIPLNGTLKNGKVVYKKKKKERKLDLRKKIRK